MLSASWLYCLEEPEPFEEGNENNKKKNSAACRC